MSIVAEFARQLHESTPRTDPPALLPTPYPGEKDKLHDVRAVIFDVYGTLINYRKPTFDDRLSTEESLKEAFRMIIERFGMALFLSKMHPSASPEQTLHDFYHGLIALDHEQSRRSDIATPEVRIERIWGLLLKMLVRHGYDVAAQGLGSEADLARCMAYAYNFWALGRGFYPGVVDALTRLKNDNMACGLLSNAQFYTPIDLTLFARDQSGDGLDDHLELFDPDLCFFSYEYGVAKPGRLLFEKLYNVLYERHILPGQAVFVGNDLRADIEPAAEIGMQTAFFCGDHRSAFLHDAAGVVVPGISFTSYDDLPLMLSFYEEKKETV